MVVVIFEVIGLKRVLILVHHVFALSSLLFHTTTKQQQNSNAVTSISIILFSHSLCVTSSLDSSSSQSSLNIITDFICFYFIGICRFTFIISHSYQPIQSSFSSPPIPSPSCTIQFSPTTCFLSIFPHSINISTPINFPPMVVLINNPSQALFNTLIIFTSSSPTTPTISHPVAAKHLHSNRKSRWRGCVGAL